MWKKTIGKENIEEKLNALRVLHRWFIFFDLELVQCSDFDQKAFTWFRDECISLRCEVQGPTNARRHFVYVVYVVERAEEGAEEGVPKWNENL